MRLFADILAVYFVLQFFWSYYRSCYRKGYKLDVWHISVFQFMLATHVILPFARSPLNAMALGPSLTVHMMPFVDEAYLITALGYGFLLIGGQLWRVELGAGIRQATATILLQPARWCLLVMQKPKIIVVASVANLMIIAGVMAYYFKVMGFGFNLRGLLLVSPVLRPISNFSAFLIIQIGNAALARSIVYRERYMFVIAVLLGAGGLFYGSRSILLSLASAAIVVWMVRLRRRLKLWVVAAGGIAAIFLAMTLDAVRAHQFSFTRTLATMGMNVAYGNSFSDVRDFAIVLSFWNGKFFGGLTYLAAILAFIPRFLSPFRDHWALGVVTATMAGFNPAEHPGLRVGMFGEAFLNFGLLGVIVVGLITGYTLRLIDLEIKAALAMRERTLLPYAFFVVALPPAILANSTAAGTFYSVAFFYVAVWVVIRISRYIRLPLG